MKDKISKRKDSGSDKKRRVIPSRRALMRSVEQLAVTTYRIIINSHTRRILCTQIEALREVSERSARDTATRYNRIIMSAVERKVLVAGVDVGVWQATAALCGSGSSNTGGRGLGYGHCG